VAAVLVAEAVAEVVLLEKQVAQVLPLQLQEHQ
jgi:hypothetical protein